MMIRSQKDEIQKDGRVQKSSRKKKQMCILCGPTDNVRCRFPKWKTFRKGWIQFCNRVNGKSVNPETSRLCHLHFNEDSLRRDETGKIVGVVPKAIPTIYTQEQIRRLKDPDTNAESDLTFIIRDAFQRLMPEAGGNEQSNIEMHQSDTALLHEELQTEMQTSQDPILESRVVNELEVRDEENEESLSGSTSTFHNENSMEGARAPDKTPTDFQLYAGENSSSTPINYSTPRSSRHTNPMMRRLSTPTNSCATDCVGTLSTPSSSHLRSKKIRRHSVRHIGDIKVTDLETPRSRSNCVSVIHHESRLMKNKIHVLQKRNLRLKNKVRNLKESLEKLRKDNLVSGDRMDELLAMLPVPLREMMLRKLNSTNTQYSAELRRFALSLHFYSPKAYAFVRKSLCNVLPGPSTIRQWCCVSNFEPGFSKEVLENLQQREKPIICCLTVDEMSIRQQVEYKHNKWYGFVNTNGEVTGQDEADHNNAAHAKSALVFLLVAINDNFKVPMEYFLIDSLSGKERANLIRTALVLAEENGVHVHALTFDGAPVNGTMAKELGAGMDVESFEPYILHPTTLEKVYCFPDPTHMIKNARNAIGGNSTVLYNST